MKRGFRFFGFGIFALLVVISVILFVMATSPPTSVTFNNNVTPVYDEGNFSVNWTAAAGTVKNYSIYISVDGGTSFYKQDWNTSLTGYSFNNWTQANYTFKVGALNTTGSGNEANATGSISIFVDRTAPVISLPSYTNATLKKNTAQLTLNISVTDASSGTTGSRCLVDINGTNESV